VYGPQKGADKSAVEALDAGLKHFAKIAGRQLGDPVDFPGAGAAGGLGAGARVFLHASIRKGVSYVIESTKLESLIQQADIVITGEGKIDGQTFSGKVVSEVSRLAGIAGKPVVAICGASEVSQEQLRRHGIRQTIVLTDENVSSEWAMANASRCIRESIAKHLPDLTRFLN
jgi:glycerate kinase